MITRDFSAKNGFGVDLPHHCRCWAEPATSTVVEVEIVEGYRY